MSNRHDRRRRLAWPALVLTALLGILAINVLAVFVPGGYLLRTGGLTFPAQTVHKPLLLLNGGFLLSLLFLRRRVPALPARLRTAAVLDRLTRPQFGLILMVLAGAVYLPSLQVNFQHYDWTHRHISAGLTSLAAFGRLFVSPQPDGMYRPLTFISLWADHRLFGSELWGYHLQSIGLHVLNAALVGVLAVRLGMAKSQGRLAALIFGAASIHFEAVVWPAARFDLLAMTFTCLTLIWFLQFWRAQGVRLGYAALCLLSFMLAVLNKEISYSAVLVIAALIATHKLWKLESSGKSKSLVLFAVLIACAGAFLAVRWALFGGIGGYGGGAAVSAKSLYLLAVNTLALSVFGVNASAPPSMWRLAAVAGFVFVVLCFSIACHGSHDRRKWALVVLALLSALPALSVIGWVQISLMHSRHLYWPSAWVAILIALLAARRCPAVLMWLFLLVQAAALTYNISTWRNVIATADNLALQVARDLHPANVRPTIELIGVPEHLDGVLYFGPELESRIGRRAPGVTVRRREEASPGGESPALAYRWDGKGRSLIRTAGR